MKRTLTLTMLAITGALCACRFVAQSEYFDENYTAWHYVQQAPQNFTEADLKALDVQSELHFTDKKTGDIVYVFRRHHTPYYQGTPDKQVAEVWRFDAETGKAKGIYSYRTERNF